MAEGALDTGEQDSMSTDDKKPDKPADKTPAILLGPNGAKPIMVKQIRIPQGNPNVMELPGQAAAKTISDAGMTRGPDGQLKEAPPNQPRTKIWYLPWLGCFAIEALKPSDEGMKRNGDIVMVPREWCQWVPFE